MLYLIIGLIIGIVIGLAIKSMHTCNGVLLIDHSDPKKDTYRFCINNLNALSGKKEIRLKINHDANLSQE